MSRLLVASLTTLILVGCAGSPGVVILVLDPTSAQVQQGHTTRFTAQLTGITDTAIDWQATGGQLVAKGTGATFIALEAGAFEVTATSRAQPEVTATATVVVTSPPGQPSLRFVTDGSLIFAGVGVTKRVEVQVIDAAGAVIDTGQVSWSTSDASIAAVSPDGDRAALVTTATTATSQAQISATFEGLTAVASILVIQPSAGTVLVDSANVVAKSETSVTLIRDAVSESLAPGQRLVSGSGAGVLAEVVAITVGTQEVVVTTIPTSLADAFDEFSFAGAIEPLEISVQLLDGREAVVTTRTPQGEFRATTVVDDVTCIVDGGAQVDLIGSDITITASLYGELAFSVFLGTDHFLAKFGAAVEVAATTGTVSYGGQGGGSAVCSLELPRIGSAPLSAGVFTLWTGFVPVLGVEVGASGTAASFSLSGPHGGIGAALEGGIEYTEASGWSPLFHSEYNADFEPFSATASLEQPVTARLAPFGRVDVGISLDLGVDALAVPIIDARFVELKGYGYLDFALPPPLDVEEPGYVGPGWSLGVGARGALKAEFQGLLPDLLDYLGIDVNFADQYQLFHEETELLVNPSLTFLATPALAAFAPGGTAPVTLTALTDDDSEGTVSFWARKDGSAALSFLASAPLENGSATTTWNAGVEGEYTLYARVSTDAVSLVKPYAAANTASVSVTEEDEEEGDKGPLGSDGPFWGTFTLFSAGTCYGEGYALTFDFFEHPDGSLTGTYIGYRCAAGCFEVDPYPSGPISGFLEGSRSGSDVTFGLSAPIGGTFTGTRFVPTAPPGSISLPVIDGTVKNSALICEDAFGITNGGFFSLVGTKAIWF